MGQYWWHSEKHVMQLLALAPAPRLQLVRARNVKVRYMLMNGAKVTIRLAFEKAGDIELTFPASMKPGGQGHGGHNMKKATQ